MTPFERVSELSRDWGFHNNLSQSYITLGQFEEGLKEGQAAAQLQPNAEPLIGGS